MTSSRSDGILSPWVDMDYDDDEGFAEYDRIDATEILEDGSLRLYRRRGPFGILRRQDVFHPAGAWLTYAVHVGGRCRVTLR